MVSARIIVLVDEINRSFTHIHWIVANWKSTCLFLELVKLTEKDSKHLVCNVANGIENCILLTDKTVSSTTTTCWTNHHHHKLPTTHPKVMGNDLSFPTLKFKEQKEPKEALLEWVTLCNGVRLPLIELPQLYVALHVVATEDFTKPHLIQQQQRIPTTAPSIWPSFFNQFLAKPVVVESEQYFEKCHKEMLEQLINLFRNKKTRPSVLKMPKQSLGKFFKTQKQTHPFRL